MARLAFNIMFGAVLVYILLGSYLYLAKILPALNKSMELTQSGLLRDVDQYLELLDEEGKRPWFTPYLRHIRAIAVACLIVVAAMIALVINES